MQCNLLAGHFVAIAPCAPATIAAPKSTTLLLPVMCFCLAVLLIPLLPLLLLLLTPLLRKLVSAASSAHRCYHQSLLPTPCLPICLMCLGPAFPWLGPGRSCPPLAPSHRVCLTLCECVRDVTRTQVHDVTHTQVQGVTCKSLTSLRACIHPWCQGSRVHACAMCCYLAQGAISARCLTVGVSRPNILR